MDFLKEILGDGYDAFKEAIKTWNENPENKEKQVEIANVKSGDYVSKKDFDALETEKKGIETQLTTATDNLKKFEGIEDPEKLQGEIARLTGELNTQKTTYENQISDMRFTATLGAAIKAAGGRNEKAVMALLDVDALKASKDQTEDIKKALDAAKESDSYLFGANEPINSPVGATTSMGDGDSATASMRAAMGLPPVEK